MASSLSNLVNSLAEGIHRIKCKLGHDDKKYEIRGIKYTYCDCFLEYTNFKDDLIEYKCLCCNKSSRKFDKKLKEQFFNTYKFSNHDNKKFILLLRKGVCPYQYMNDWEKANGTSLPEKEDFYSHLNLQDITYADYAHAKRVCKDFEIKNFEEYHDLYVQSDILLLADVFENFRNICLKIYELDHPKFILPPRLVWKAALKKTIVKLDLLTDIDMLLIVEKGIRRGICHSIY